MSESSNREEVSKEKSSISHWAKRAAFVMLGVIAFYFVYRDFDFSRLLNTETKFGWVYLSLILALISHLVRALRWNLIIDSTTDAPENRKSSRYNSFLSVMSGYCINLIIPRAGEVSRCGLMAKSEERSIATLLGTVVQERVIDLCMLLIGIATIFFLDFRVIFTQLDNTIEINKKISLITEYPLIAASVIILSIFISIFAIKRSSKFQIFNRFRDGFTSIIQLKQKGKYIIYSMLIWMLYFSMNYICFFAFSFTEELPLTAGLVVFIFGSLGMVAPVQGGVGAWHFMTIQALAIYSVAEGDALLFAFIVHTSMNLMLLVFGGISFGMLSLSLKKTKE